MRGTEEPRGPRFFIFSATELSVPRRGDNADRTSCTAGSAVFFFFFFFALVSRTAEKSKVCFSLAGYVFCSCRLSCAPLRRPSHSLHVYSRSVYVSSSFTSPRGFGSFRAARALYLFFGRRLRVHPLYCCVAAVLQRLYFSRSTNAARAIMKNVMRRFRGPQKSVRIYGDTFVIRSAN